MGQLLRRANVGNGSVSHHGDAVAHREKLIVIRTDQQDGTALRGQPVDQAVDRKLGADVDPLRGFIEDQDPSVGQQPTGDDHLLLIAAGQVLDGLVLGPARKFQLARQSLGFGVFPPQVQEPEGGEFGQAGAGNIRPPVEVEEQPVGLAVFRDQRETGTDRVRGTWNPHGPTVDGDLPRCQRIQPEQRARNLGAARTKDAAQAQNLAAMEGEGYVFDPRGAAEAGRGQHRFGPCIAFLGVMVLHVAADHGADDRVHFHRRLAGGADHPGRPAWWWPRRPARWPRPARWET